MAKELVEVVWFGGKRRDGRMNDFGFVKTANSKELHIHESTLSEELKKIGLKEFMEIFVEFNDKGKIMKAYHLSEVSPEEQLKILCQTKSYHFITDVLRVLPFDSINQAVLKECIEQVDEGHVHMKLVENYFEKGTLSEKSALLIDDPKLKELTRPMLAQFVEEPLAYHPIIEGKLLASLDLTMFPLKVPFAFIDEYPQLIRHVQLDEYAVLRSLQDERFSALQWDKLQQELNDKQHILEVGLEPDLEESFFEITIQGWFNDEQLYPFISNTLLYPYFIRSYLNSAIGQPEFEKALTYFEQYFEKEQRELSDKYWRGYNLNILHYGPILKQLPKLMQFEVLNDDAHININQMLKVFQSTLPSINDWNWKILNDVYKKHQAFYEFSPLLERVEAAYKELMSNPQSFMRHTPLIKNYLIYKIAENYKGVRHWLTCPIIIQLGQQEQHPLVKALLYLLYERVNKDNGANASIDLEHYILQPIDQVIFEQANTRKGFDLLLLLPRCEISASGVKHCEGKQIFYKSTDPLGALIEEKQVTYCPRTRKSCSPYRCLTIFNESRITPGSRIGANLKLPYEHWSIQEMFAFAQVEPLSEMLKTDRVKNYYVNKIAGWVNRLEEIIERMECSNKMCKHPFKVNFEFSKRYDAVYNTTVFSCPKNEDNQNPGHDYKIYISHCRCCGKLIDSRESKYRVHAKGIYMCIHCAAADAQYAYNPIWDMTPNRIYQQGDICPACNYREKPMKDLEPKWKKCNQCNHKIKITN